MKQWNAAVQDLSAVGGSTTKSDAKKIQRAMSQDAVSRYGRVIQGLPRDFFLRRLAFRRRDELLRVDTCLREDAVEGSSLNLTVQRDGTAAGIVPHHDMAAPLPDLNKAQLFERFHALATANAR